MDSAFRDRLLQRLDSLPLLPTALMQLMALDRSAEDLPDRVVEIIETEPNLAARVLMAAGSAQQGVRQPPSTVRGAVTRLGAGPVIDMVASAGMTTVFVPRDPWERGLWRHSLHVASACRELARVAGLPRSSTDLAYVAGLVHDIGRFVMFQEAPEVLRRVDEGQRSTPEDLIDEERSICGLTHTEIAAEVCRRWGLPPSITLVAALHHAPELSDKLPESQAHLIELVKFVDLSVFPSGLPDAAEDRLDLDTVETQIHPHLPGWIDLDAAALLSTLRDSLAAADAAADALGV